MKGQWGKADLGLNAEQKLVQYEKRRFDKLRQIKKNFNTKISNFTKIIKF
jgi:hypothetical protein